MLGRFLAALLLVMLVALAGTALEKHNREQLRQISLQTYRWQVLFKLPMPWPQLACVLRPVRIQARSSRP